MEAFRVEFLGAPLLLLGLGLVDSPRSPASVGGVYLLLLVASVGTLAWSRPRLAPIALLFLLPPPPFPHPPTHQALVVQGGQSPLEKRDNWLSSIPYPSLTQEALGGARGGVELVIWPETASPVPYARKGVSWLGGVGGERRNEIHYTEDGVLVDMCSKADLIPLLEASPKPLEGPRAWALRAVVGGEPALERGALRPLGRFGVLICYEASLERGAALLAGRGAEVLVVLTNEGYFDGTLLKRRRLREDRLRAVETGLWLVRAAETGFSGSVDPHGRVVFLAPEGVSEPGACPTGTAVGTPLRQAPPASPRREVMKKGMKRWTQRGVVMVFVLYALFLALAPHLHHPVPAIPRGSGETEKALLAINPSATPEQQALLDQTMMDLAEEARAWAGGTWPLAAALSEEAGPPCSRALRPLLSTCEKGRDTSPCASDGEG